MVVLLKLKCRFLQVYLSEEIVFLKLCSLVRNASLQANFLLIVSDSLPARTLLSEGVRRYIRKVRSDKYDCVCSCTIYMLCINYGIWNHIWLKPGASEERTECIKCDQIFRFDLIFLQQLFEHELIKSSQKTWHGGEWMLIKGPQPILAGNAMMWHQKIIVLIKQ